jgi:hypothetical protein
MPYPRWSRKVMLVNSALLYPVVLLGGALLYVNAMPIFWLYLFIWIAILTIGRYYVCRPCLYYGQDCPSFGFGHVARMFTKDGNNRFSARACIIDIIAIGVLLLLPVGVWVLSLFGMASVFGPLSQILMGVYVMGAVAMMTVHEMTGCRKCEIVECPTSRAAKERKKTGLPISP